MHQRSGSTNYMKFNTEYYRQYLFGSAPEYIFEESKVNNISPGKQPKLAIDINAMNIGAPTTMLLKTEEYNNQEPQNTASQTMGEYSTQPQVELAGHSIVCTSYPYSDPNIGMVSACGPQNLVQYNPEGVCYTKKALPLEVTEEPVYVNPKQYRGILRRRQSRAKAVLEKKPAKSRKPYLHESRHLHAMRRARGSGGRFLNTKKPESHPSNANTCKTTNYESSSMSNAGKSALFSTNNGDSFFCKEVRDKETVQRFQDYSDVNSHYHRYPQRPESSIFYSFLHQNVTEGDISLKQNRPLKAETSRYLV